MKDFINNICLTGVTYEKRDLEFQLKLIQTMTDNLNLQIEKFNKQLSELENARRDIAKDTVIFLWRNTNSDYGYFDGYGENYAHQYTNGKHILIDKDFNVYEIIDGYQISDINKSNRTRSYIISSWIEAILKVRLLSSHHITK